jgi:hypothetical protein
MTLKASLALNVSVASHMYIRTCFVQTVLVDAEHEDLTAIACSAYMGVDRSFPDPRCRRLPLKGEF